MLVTSWLQSLRSRTVRPARRRSARRQLPSVPAECQELERRLLLYAVANDDSFALQHDTTLNQAAPGVLSNDFSDTGTLTAVLATGPSYATSFQLNSDGSFSYTPQANWAGSDSFTYYANDGLSNSAAATVTLSVRNYAPTANADEYTTIPTRTATRCTPSWSRTPHTVRSRSMPTVRSSTRPTKSAGWGPTRSSTPRATVSMRASRP